MCTLGQYLLIVPDLVYLQPKMSRLWYSKPYFNPLINLYPLRINKSSLTTEHRYPCKAHLSVITPLGFQMCLWICVFVECTYLENTEQNAPQRIEEILTRLRRPQMSNPANIPKKGGTEVRKNKKWLKLKVKYLTKSLTYLALFVKNA